MGFNSGFKGLSDFILVLVLSKRDRLSKTESYKDGRTGGRNTFLEVCGWYVTSFRGLGMADGNKLRIRRTDL